MSKSEVICLGGHSEPEFRLVGIKTVSTAYPGIDHKALTPANWNAPAAIFIGPRESATLTKLLSMLKPYRCVYQVETLHAARNHPEYQRVNLVMFEDQTASAAGESAADALFFSHMRSGGRDIEFVVLPAGELID